MYMPFAVCLTKSATGDCYLERLPDLRMAVDQTGKMMVIFPSITLTLALMSELSAEGIPSLAQCWVEQTEN